MNEWIAEMAFYLRRRHVSKVSKKNVEVNAKLLIAQYYIYAKMTRKKKEISFLDYFFFFFLS